MFLFLLYFHSVDYTSCNNEALFSTVGGWIIVMELFPGFSLYRGLYEFSQYAFIGYYMGTKGMRWGDLSTSTNGMKVALIIMVVEWLFVLLVAYYIDQVQSTGNRTSPLSFLKSFQKKRSSSFRRPSLRKQGSQVFVDMEKPDVAQEVKHHLLISDFFKAFRDRCFLVTGRICFP